MAKNGFKAMDSDMHVMEPCDLWQKYIDQKYRRSRTHRFEPPQTRPWRSGRRQDHAAPRRRRPIPRSRPFANDSQRNATPKKKRATSTTSLKSRAMDKEGLDVAILYPSRGSVRPRRRRPRSRSRRRHRQSLQRLDARLLQSRSRAHVRRRHRRAARCLLGGRRNPPLRQRNWASEAS